MKLIGRRLMKLLVIIVQDYDAAELRRVMIEDGFRITQISTTGGFLRTGNTTFLAGVEDHQVHQLVRLVDANCRERMEVIRPTGLADFEEWYPPDQLEVEVGGATVFVLDVARFERIT